MKRKALRIKDVPPEIQSAAIIAAALLESRVKARAGAEEEGLYSNRVVRSAIEILSEYSKNRDVDLTDVPDPS